MQAKTEKTWIRGGMAVSLGLAALFLLRGKWGMARVAGGFAAAFLEKQRDARMAREVGGILSKAGRIS